MLPLTLAAVLVLVACAAAQARGDADPLATPGCLAARQQLEQALDAGGPRERLNAARRQAARECLGRTPPPPQGRFVPPPVAVAPIPLPPAPALPPVQAAAPPATAIPRSPVITICDDAGCWDSSGARHNRHGPLLVGPRGLCTLQGGLLNCP